MASKILPIVLFAVAGFVAWKFWKSRQTNSKTPQEQVIAKEGSGSNPFNFSSALSGLTGSFGNFPTLGGGFLGGIADKVKATVSGNGEMTAVPEQPVFTKEGDGPTLL